MKPGNTVLLSALVHVFRKATKTPPELKPKLPPGLTRPYLFNTFIIIVVIIAVCVLIAIVTSL